MTLLLTRSDLSALLTMEECIGRVEEAFRDGDPASARSLGMHAPSGTFHAKAALGDVFAIKINANFPDNPGRHDLPTIQGVIVLFDIDRGVPLAILDSTLITTLRTAAATAVAAKYLARPDASTAAIIGHGVQGQAALEALRLVRPIREVRIYDVRGAVTTLDAAVDGADIVVTATPSRVAIIEERHLQPGMFVAATGADNPQKQELAPAVLARCRVVADVIEQAATMGDLHHALAAGAMTREDVHGELGAVIAGRIAGRRTDEEMFVFDSTGTALQDVAVASLAYRRAMERVAGTQWTAA